MDEDETRDTAMALTALLIAAATITFLVIMVLEVPARDLCLSKSEARKLWPTRHLYWYSSDHCWSNRRGPPRGIKVDPIKENTAMAQAAPGTDPNGNPRTVVKTVQADQYNELDAEADKDVFFNAQPFPYWAHVMQYDLSRFKTWYERIETWR